MCLFRCYIWTNQVFSKRLYIIWEVLYSITWIPWRSILVNINFHVIQFSLMSVFLQNGMKTYILDICLFSLFAKAIPEKVLKLSKSYWLIFYRLVNFDIHYREKLCREELFNGSKLRIFHKKCYHFSPTVFFPINILLFCHLQLRLKPIRWNSN